MIKRWLYGVIPHVFTSVFNPASEKLAYYDILRKEGYSHFPYPFAKAYLELPVEVMDDPQKGLPYVLHDGNKRLYYPREWTPERIRKNYRSLRIEQDPRHAHHYIDNRAELRERTLLDVGAAEGIFSLDVIEEVKAVYLFECEKQWIEALHATFEPWAEKVTIVQKFVGNSNDATHTTLDRFAEEQQLQSPVFLKMDIEGTECEALMGGGFYCLSTTWSLPSASITARGTHGLLPRISPNTDATTNSGKDSYTSSIACGAASFVATITDKIPIHYEQ